MNDAVNRREIVEKSQCTFNYSHNRQRVCFSLEKKVKSQYLRWISFQVFGKANTKFPDSLANQFIIIFTLHFTFAVAKRDISFHTSVHRSLCFVVSEQRAAWMQESWNLFTIGSWCRLHFWHREMFSMEKKLFHCYFKSISQPTPFQLAKQQSSPTSDIMTSRLFKINEIFSTNRKTFDMNVMKIFFAKLQTQDIEYFAYAAMSHLFHNYEYLQ